MGNCCKTDKPARPSTTSPTSDLHTNEVILQTPMLRSYQKLISEEPLNGQLRAAYGKMLYRMGLEDFAFIQLKAALTLNSADGESYSILAEIYEKREEKFEMEEILREGCAKHEDYMPVFVKIAELCANAGDFEAAYHYAGKGLRLGEDNEVLLNCIGQYHLRKNKNHVLATKFFQRAIRANPNYSKAYEGLGRVYKKIGKISEARRAFLDAQRLSSQSSCYLSTIYLGSLCILQGDLVSAAEYFEKAKDSSSSEALKLLRSKGYLDLIEKKCVVEGIENVIRGEFEKAIQVLSAEGDLLERNVVASYFLAEARAALGNHDAALMLYRKVLLKGLDEEVHAKKFLAGFVQKAQNRVESALRKQAERMKSCELKEIDIKEGADKTGGYVMKEMRVTKKGKAAVESEPAPISIMVVNENNKAEETEMDPQVRKTAKNSLAGQPVRTNSFYQALCAANQQELALEQKYCSRPETRSSDERAFDSHIISNYLKYQT